MSEKNIDILREILGSKIKEILRLSNDVHRYLWEQTLAICLYSREIYVVDERARDFHNRMLLVHCIKQVRKEEDQLSLLNLLESNASSSAMMELLKDLGLGHIIKMMEDLYIAFPEKTSNYYYSYWKMYHSLSNSINLFKELLKINVNEKLLVEISCAYYRNKLSHRTLNKKITDLLKFEDLGELYFNNKDFMLNERDGLTNYLYSYILNYFSKLSNDLFKNSNFYINKEDLLDNYIDVIKGKDSIRIEINNQFLDSFIDIGQYDSIINAIKRKIITTKEDDKTSLFLNHRQEQNKNISSEFILRSISQWQKKNSISLVTKIEQCPRRIAGIIKFDLEHRIGIFSTNFSNSLGSCINYNKILTRNGIVKSISTIIKLFLYYDYDLFDDYIWGDRFYSVDFSSDTPNVSRENLELDGKRIFNSKIMKDWIGPDIKSTTELYKKIPKDIFDSISKKVKMQIDDSRKDSENSFPLCEEVPMPLWVRF